MPTPREKTPDVELHVDSKSLTFSNLFQAEDADVIIHSSDNVEFRLHKKNLEFATGGFPTAQTPTNEEVVGLSESSATLELLFQFVYPRQHPNLQGIGFPSVLKLAEAAEKYEVYSAIPVSHLKLRDFVESNSKEVLHFACKYSSEPLIERLAPAMVHIPLQQIASSLRLCPRFLCAWALYRDRYACVLLEIAKHFPRHCGLENHDTREKVVEREKFLESGMTQPSPGRRNFAFDLVSTFDTQKIPGGGNCCSSYGGHWNATTLKKIAAGMPRFSL